MDNLEAYHKHHRQLLRYVPTESSSSTNNVAIQPNNVAGSPTGAETMTMANNNQQLNMTITFPGQQPTTSTVNIVLAKNGSKRRI
jgi:hypothetical protein